MERIFTKIVRHLCGEICTLGGNKDSKIISEKLMEENLENVVNTKTMRTFTREASMKDIRFSGNC